MKEYESPVIEIVKFETEDIALNPSEVGAGNQYDFGEEFNKD